VCRARRGASAGYEYDLEDALLVPLACSDYAIIREIFAKTRLSSRRTVGREGLQSGTVPGRPGQDRRNGLLQP
jgi:hypothetical protein